MEDFEFEFVVDSELEGEITKYKASVSRTYSYGGETSPEYTLKVDGDGNLEVDKSENSYVIEFEV